jgi:hypothetical protein
MFNRKIISSLALFSIVAPVLIYRRAEQVRPVRPIGTPQTIATPLGLPPVPVPATPPKRSGVLRRGVSVIGMSLP